MDGCIGGAASAHGNTLTQQCVFVLCGVWRVAEYGGVESDRCMGVEPDGMFVHLFCV